MLPYPGLCHVKHATRKRLASQVRIANIFQPAGHLLALTVDIKFYLVFNNIFDAPFSPIPLIEPYKPSYRHGPEYPPLTPSNVGKIPIQLVSSLCPNPRLCFKPRRLAFNNEKFDFLDFLVLDQMRGEQIGVASAKLHFRACGVCLLGGVEVIQNDVPDSGGFSFRIRGAEPVADVPL
ncbi:MAG: hypothetical protein M1834_008241 [Cirrosporium novae-zelandiae]|nr:MAG: hypothetical protein M1834_008241 [Cirrosporium novae-zelandiae]